MQNIDAKLWNVTTCKGRLDHLEQTAPSLLEQGINYCLVDYDCPQRSGDWLSAFAFSAGFAAQIAVVRHADAPRFHKTRALNMGVAAAIAHGATHLVFSDSDTLHTSGSVAAIRSLLSASGFVIAGRDAENRPVPSLTGFLGVAVADLIAAGGYDEDFAGWGAEDIELRLRLHVRDGVRYHELDSHFLRAIPHADALRSEFHEEKNFRASSATNNAKLEGKLSSWTGAGFTDLSGSAARLLLGQPCLRDYWSGRIVEGARP